MESRAAFGFMLVFAFLLFPGIVFGAIFASRMGGDMTLERRPNTLSSQIWLERYFDMLFGPGAEANLNLRGTLVNGVVKDESIVINSNLYTATVAAQTRFAATVDVPNVQFSVPVKAGDVVSLEVIEGNPQNGIVGKPVRPLGPNVFYFTGPETSAEYNADAAVGPHDRGRNADLMSYVIPLQTTGNSRVHTPLESSSDSSVLFAIPEPIRIINFPVSFYIEMTAKLRGGLRIVGGDRAGDYALRVPSAKMTVSAQDVRLGVRLSAINTHYGLEGAAVSSNPVTRTYDGNSYVDMGGYEIPANGEHLLFAQEKFSIQGSVGSYFVLPISVSTPALSDLQYYREVTHPAFEHPAHPQITFTAGVIDVTPQHPLHAAHSHPEYSFRVWDTLAAPGDNETYYIWLGISDVKVNIVELGTGSG